jgi:hypothetical protein
MLYHPRWRDFNACFLPLIPSISHRGLGLRADPIGQGITLPEIPFPFYCIK